MEIFLYKIQDYNHSNSLTLFQKKMGTSIWKYIINLFYSQQKSNLKLSKLQQNKTTGTVTSS